MPAETDPDEELVVAAGALLIVLVVGATYTEVLSMVGAT
jgi:hypothetical protein